MLQVQVLLFPPDSSGFFGMMCNVVEYNRCGHVGTTSREDGIMAKSKSIKSYKKQAAAKRVWASAKSNWRKAKKG